LDWLKTCKEWTLAGQNPSFDRSFLEETAHRYHINWPLAHRTVDLHSIAYYHIKKRGLEPPQKNNHSALNLDRILRYVGLPTRAKKHNALEDAKLEAEALARLLYQKNLVPDYKGLPLSAI
jgi:DNA polymerase III epsilon subunit-like protein